MGGKQQLHNAQPRLCPHRRKHVRKFRHLFRVLFCCVPHNSIIAEIRKHVKPSRHTPERRTHKKKQGGTGTRCRRRSTIRGRHNCAGLGCLVTPSALSGRIERVDFPAETIAAAIHERRKPCIERTSSSPNWSCVTGTPRSSSTKVSLEPKKDTE